VAIDGRPESVPGALPAGLTAEAAAGNHVIIDMGNGHYAMYAHLATGTLKVKVGDTVTRGQVLGLLGNTGNSDSPHLHFQVMDRPSALDANGLPFVFDEMEFEGMATGTIADLDKNSVGGIPFKIDASGKGPRKLEYPKNLDVIGFK
jgi:murein DD-endopeptidase MepM/ murein hydrolase activator NlpD